MKDEIEKNGTDFSHVVDIVSIGVDTESKMVAIPGTNFMMGQTAVTQRLYQKVMGVNPSYYQLSNEELHDEGREALKEIGDTSNNPVEFIFWFDAIYFCNKLSMMEGLTPAYSVSGETDQKSWDYTPHDKRGWNIDFDVDCDFKASGYRLPTKHEWDYAARGGENYIYSGSNDLDKVGWYSKNSKNVTHPVAQKMANGYGLYDMSGNVSEWAWGFWDLFFNHRREDFFNWWCYKCGGELSSDANHCKLSHSRYSPAFASYSYTGFRLLRLKDY